MEASQPVGCIDYKDPKGIHIVLFKREIKDTEILVLYDRNTIKSINIRVTEDLVYYGKLYSDFP